MTVQPSAGAGRRVLATDLDGTLIPLAGEQQNLADLDSLATQLAARDVTLVFVTGRHLESVTRAIAEFGLPVPEWIICDVGTSLFRREASGTFTPVQAYWQRQDEIVAEMPIATLHDRLRSIEGLRLQEDEKQGRFKLSFYADAAELAALTSRVREELTRASAPYSVIDSVDPFTGDGLIDLLPSDVSKAHALSWWVDYVGMEPEGVVFAGDSGNDLAALAAGYRAIVVGNADRRLARQVYDTHRDAGWKDRLHLARGVATSGVLEGCRWFEICEQVTEPSSLQQLGATPISQGETHFRVWAPKRRNVAVEVLDGENQFRSELTRSEFGYFSGTVANVSPGTQYRYVLDESAARPDPASRYQPDGVHGPSQVIDPKAFPWKDATWPGVPKRDLVLYELHIGAFTQDGTFQAAIERLSELVELGVSAIEVMPIAQSPGRWNWGYDGVDLYAVRNTYGEPDDFKAFVDASHAAGLAVILDVVYNHVGPEGNYLAEFGPFFSRKHHSPWGETFNFDEKHARHVRRFIVENAVYWLREYHLDGLRLDAVRFMFDESSPTILEEIRQTVSEYASTIDRAIHLFAESNVFVSELLKTEDARTAYDGIWCDCLTQSIYSHALPELRLTGRQYRGADDLATALRHGYVYKTGNTTDAIRQSFATVYQVSTAQSYISSVVTALQTHDAVGNHPAGKRLHQLTSKSFQKAAAGLVLLHPSIPLIFMGEEHAADAPFPFFVDFGDRRLRRAADRGRMKEHSQHDWHGTLRPSDERAFCSAKCCSSGSDDENMRSWYRNVLSLRKEGLTEGWLSPAGMSVAYDAGTNVFTLRFDMTGGGAVTIQARLNRPNTLTEGTVDIPMDGELVLSSEPNPKNADGHVRLYSDHVVISRS